MTGPDANEAIGVTKYAVLHQCPRWFEHPAFTVFETSFSERSWVYWVVLGWLIVAPFVAGARRLTTAIFGANVCNALA